MTSQTTKQIESNNNNFNVVITGCGSYLPAKIVTNEELAKSIDTSDEWIVSRTGIKQRHITAPDELTSDLATHSLIKALEDAELQANSLDAIVLATTTPDMIMPSTAVKVQSNIGMNQGFAFDIQAACSGFIYALNTAYSLIQSGQANKVAVIGAETMSKVLNWQDRSTCVLFGDGAGTVILEKVIGSNNNLYNSSGIKAIQIFSAPNSIDILKVDGGVSKGNIDAKLSMVGKEVYKHAVEKMAESIIHLLKKNNLDIEDLDWVLPHQANSRMFPVIADKLRINLDKIVSTVTQHANTSAASIPLALDQYLKAGKIKKGQLIGLTAVGAGITWGSAIIRL